MPRPTRKLLDTSPRGRHIGGRLKKEIIVWLATANPDGKPLVVPVWFLFDGASFLVYSVPGQKVRNSSATHWCLCISTRLPTAVTSCV